MAREAILTAILKDGITGPAKAIHGEMSKLSKVSGGLHGVAGKLTGGLKGLAGSVFSLQGALVGGGLVAAITAMTKAAADDAASQAKLETAIKANAKAAGDYTAAVDATIKAGQALAFTDDQTRDSLARLVTSTRDVKEATELNAVAMDLARLKGITLADAANIVGKVHDGNVGILGRYGISVKEGATATEAMAAIQAAAAGQAEAFGNSSAGAFAKMQDGIGEAAESLGAILLPIVTSLVQFLNDSVVPAIGAVIAGVSSWVEGNRPMIDQIGGFVSGALAELVTVIQTQVIPAVTQIAGKIGEFTATIVAQAGPAVLGFVKGLLDLIGVVVTQVIPTLMDLAQRVWQNGLNKYVAAGVQVISSVIEVLSGLFTLIVENEDVMAALKLAADLIGKAFGFVADGILFVLDLLGNLGDAIRSSKPIMDVLAGVGKAIGTAFDIAAAAIRAVIAALQSAIAIARQAIDIIASVPGVGLAADIVGNAAKALTGKAAGGPVTGGQPYLVGERGPEVFVPQGSGFIVPNGASAGPLAPVTIPIIVDGREIARVVDEHLFYDYRIGARGVVGG